MKIINIIKITAINLVTVGMLLVIVNWACGLYLKKTSKADRSSLPNYAGNYDHAKKIFYDYDKVQHQYEPFVAWKMQPYNGQTLRVSNEGLRELPAVTPADTKGKTVRFFGGSTMWGEGSDDAHTIPALFNAENPQYKVFNHAQLAYNSRQELEALISSYARNEKSDIVIFYDGVNDAAFLCPKEIKQLPAHRLVPMYREKLYTGKSALILGLMNDLFIDNILKVIHKVTYKRIPENSPYDCHTNPEKAEQIADIMMKNWEMAHEIVTARNGEFMAVLQPAAYIGKPRTDHLDLDEDLGKNFQEIYKRLKAKIAARKYPWIIDLSDRFDGNDYIYIDFCHVSPNGNEIIAREISKAVRNQENQHVAVSFLHP